MICISSLSSSSSSSSSSPLSSSSSSSSSPSWRAVSPSLGHLGQLLHWRSSLNRALRNLSSGLHRLTWNMIREDVQYYLADKAKSSERGWGICAAFLAKFLSVKRPLLYQTKLHFFHGWKLPWWLQLRAWKSILPWRGFQRCGCFLGHHLEPKGCTPRDGHWWWLWQ